MWRSYYVTLHITLYHIAYNIAPCSMQYYVKYFNCGIDFYLILCYYVVMSKENKQNVNECLFICPLFIKQRTIKQGYRIYCECCRLVYEYNKSFVAGYCCSYNYVNCPHFKNWEEVNKYDQ